LPVFYFSDESKENLVRYGNMLKKHSACDEGFAGSLINGCDYSGGNPQDDYLFDAYNKECFL